MIMNKKDKIIEQLEKFGFPENEVVLTLDEFFADNDAFFAGPEGYASIGVNISPNQPSPQTFYETLKFLIDTYKATNIFAKITDAEEPEDWFFTDTVYIVSDLDIDEIAILTKNLSPDEIGEGWCSGLPVNIDKSYLNKSVYFLFWD
jgi:hypothetical protein